METIRFILQLCILLGLLAMLGISYFHAHQTAKIEKKLGILIPKKIKTFTNFQLTFLIVGIILFSFLFLLSNPSS